jgi:hypothetical protein
MTTTITRPERTEADAYYFTYIDQVPAGDIRDVLQSQVQDVITQLQNISDDRSRHRYAPGKWSIREVVNHVNDIERVFTFRALWFARGHDAPLPSFDENVGASAAHADDRPWSSLVDEFRAVRGATLPLFLNLPAEAWTRRGEASGKPITVRALAYATAGHVAHHMRLLRERYL